MSNDTYSLPFLTGGAIKASTGPSRLRYNSIFAVDSQFLYLRNKNLRMSSNRPFEKNDGKKIRRRQGPRKKGLSADQDPSGITQGDLELSPEDEYLLKLGNRIYELRYKAGYTQREFAYRINLDNSKLAKIENGQINITILTLQAIYKGLGIAAEVFWKF